MKPRRMTDVARAVEGLFLGEDVEVTSVAIDSRDLLPGALFVALPGERTDGGRFVPEAFANGAAGVFVRDGLDVDGPAVSVRSTGEALMMLARDERTRMDATVIAVTGANGKTSTKDLTAAVLALGVPYAREPGVVQQRGRAADDAAGRGAGLRRSSSPRWAPGTSATSPSCVRSRGPTSRSSRTSGVAHLEVFGSWERIVQASAEPVEALGPDGVAILNADDPVVAGYAGRTLGAGRDVRPCTRTPTCAQRTSRWGPTAARPSPWCTRLSGCRSPWPSPASTWCRTRSPRRRPGSTLGRDARGLR